jgi:hypothetical protein
MTWAQRRIGAIAVAFVVVCAALVAWSPPVTNWSPDCGAKLLQTAAIRVEGGHFRYDVPYVGKPYDPDMLAVPVGATYYDKRGGEVHIAWPELFPLLVAPFYAAFGWFGLFVVPILAGAASVALAGAAAERVRPKSGWVAAAVTAASTPVLIYGALYWEHTTALLLEMVALLLVTAHAIDGKRWRVALAAAAVGLASAGLRGDVVLFAAALLGAAFLATPGRGKWHVALLAAAGFVVGSAPAWAMNHSISGYWLPSNAVKNVPPPSLAYLVKARVVGLVPHFFVGKTDGLGHNLPPALTWSFVLAVLVLVSTYYARGVGTRLRSFALVAASGTLAVCALVCLDAVRSDRFHGWLAMSPVLTLAFLRSPAPLATGPARARRTVALALAAFVLLNMGAVGLTYPEGFAGDGNLEWGPRYWLAVFPLAAVLLAINHDALASAVTTPRLAAMVWGALFAVGILFNRVGILRIHRNLVDQAEIRAVLQKAGDEPLLTDVYWVSGMVPEAFARRPSFLVRHEYPERFPQWLSLAMAHGLSHFAFASFKDAAAHPFLEREIPECDCVLVVGRPLRAGNDFRLSRVRIVQGLPHDGHALFEGPAGAHVVYGEIYRRYLAVGGPASYLGLPVSDEMHANRFCVDGRVFVFEHGTIDFCPYVGAWAHSDPREGYPGQDELDEEE